MKSYLTFYFFFPCFVLTFSFFAAAQEDGPISVELPDESEWPEETEPPAGDPPPPSEEPPPVFEPVAPAIVGPPPTPAITPPPATPAPVPIQPQVYPPAPTQAPTQPEPTDAKQPTLMGEPEDEAAQQEKESILPWFTVAPKVGYLFFPKSTLTYSGLKSTVEARNGLIAKIHFDVGGDGLSLEIAPFFAIETGGIKPLDQASTVNLSEGLQTGSFQAVGGQMMVTYKFNAGYFFPTIGLGLHADYLMGSEIEYGTELYGRIPLGFSLYMGKHIALTMEIGLMYGATGIKTPFQIPPELDPIMNNMDPNTLAEFENASTPADYENWYNNNQAELDQLILDHQHELPPEYSEYDSSDLMNDLAQEQLAKSIRFGRGFGMDICIGIRFP